MPELTIESLNEHIIKVKYGQEMVEDLRGDTGIFERYLGGLYMAYELVTGSKHPDVMPDESKVRPDQVG